MRCALAAVGFINENCLHNKKVIIDTMKQYAGCADVVIFGEAFLQGFYGVNFNPEHDKKIAISKEDAIIREIAAIAKECEIAVSFGFIEKEEEIFYSSQILIDATGKVMDLYRRVSEGWKEEIAGERYQEGKAFRTFDFMGKKVAVGLCGDLWFEENVNAVCLDKEGDEIAKGGAALFENGEIISEIPSGEEGVLLVGV